MKEYFVKYVTIEGDVETVCVEARSKEEARIQLKKEYWDVHEILKVYNNE